MLMSGNRTERSRPVWKGNIIKSFIIKGKVGGFKRSLWHQGEE